VPLLLPPAHNWQVGPFHHKHDAIYRSQGRTSENSILANFSEHCLGEVRRIPLLGRSRISCGVASCCSFCIGGKVLTFIYAFGSIDTSMASNLLKGGYVRKVLLVVSLCLVFVLVIASSAFAQSSSTYTSASSSSSASSSASSGSTATASARYPSPPLPPTGGASVLALGAGAMLLGSGIVSLGLLRRR
jgi:hypothetical protein